MNITIKAIYMLGLDYAKSQSVVQILPDRNNENSVFF